MIEDHYFFPVKPVSSNMMFAGPQFYKRKQYVVFQTQIFAILAGKQAYWKFGVRPIRIEVIAAFSSRAFDLDNCIKPLLDTLQSFHMFAEFDDKNVYEISLTKKLVKRGKESLDVVIKDVGRH